jgi:protein tyrosine/serine phosphatase
MLAGPNEAVAATKAREREDRKPVELNGSVVFHCAGGKDRTGLVALW